MTKSITQKFALLAVMLLTLLQATAKNNGFFTSEPERAGAIGIRMEQAGDLFIVQQCMRGADDQWIVFRADKADNGDIVLEPCITFAVSYAMKVKIIGKPKASRIIGPNSDSPRFEGHYNNLPLENNGSIGIHHENVTMIKAYCDYLANPEAYDPDSVAVFPDHKYALNQIYLDRVVANQKAAKEARQAVEDSQAKSAGMVALLLLIPFAMCVWLGLVTRGDRIKKQFGFKVKWIAICQVVQVVTIAVCLPFITQAPWYVIVLAVIGVVLFAVYDIFFMWFAIDAIKEHPANIRAKFPWIPAIIFGIIGMFLPYSLLALIALSATGIEIQQGGITDLIIGIVVTIVLIIAIGFWYRRSLAKLLPETVGNFLPLAVMTIAGALSSMALLIFVIAFAIFKGTGKMALSESGSQSGGNTGGGSQADVSCSNCCWYATDHCPYGSFAMGDAPCRHHKRR